MASTTCSAMAMHEVAAGEGALRMESMTVSRCLDWQDGERWLAGPG